MAIDVTTAFLLVVALQLVMIAMLGFMIDRKKAPARSPRTVVAHAATLDAVAHPPHVAASSRPHRHAWVPRSEEMTMGKRIRVCTCASCPDVLREEVADGEASR